MLKIVVPTALAHLVDDKVASRNSHRFVTHLDLHVTLLKLANAVNPQSVQPFASWSKRGWPNRRFAFDLLHELVPRNRTCNDAAVPPAWCNCFKEREANECEICPKDGCVRAGRKDIKNAMDKFTAEDDLSSYDSTE